MPETKEPSLWDALEQRDEAIASVSENAGRAFMDQAAAFVIRHLSRGPAPGEDITDACKAAGIKPHDDRAFGAVYLRLQRAGKIEKCGTVARRRGHGTSGGSIWRLTQK